MVEAPKRLLTSTLPTLHDLTEGSANIAPGLAGCDAAIVFRLQCRLLSVSRPSAQVSEGKELAPDDLAKLSKVKAKIEIVGDYADMEKVRDVLKQLSSN